MPRNLPLYSDLAEPQQKTREPINGRRAGPSAYPPRRWPLALGSAARAFPRAGGFSGCVSLRVATGLWPDGLCCERASPFPGEPVRGRRAEPCGRSRSRAGARARALLCQPAPAPARGPPAARPLRAPWSRFPIPSTAPPSKSTSIHLSGRTRGGGASGRGPGTALCTPFSTRGAGGARGGVSPGDVPAPPRLRVRPPAWARGGGGPGACAVSGSPQRARRARPLALLAGAVQRSGPFPQPGRTP